MNWRLTVKPVRVPEEVSTLPLVSVTMDHWMCTSERPGWMALLSCLFTAFTVCEEVVMNSAAPPVPDFQQLIQRSKSTSGSCQTSDCVSADSISNTKCKQSRVLSVRSYKLKSVIIVDNYNVSESLINSLKLPCPSLIRNITRLAFSSNIRVN